MLMEVTPTNTWLWDVWQRFSQDDLYHIELNTMSLYIQTLGHYYKGILTLELLSL